ncbi:MAG: DUF2911 domain-containing protein [Planctomycetota bacterium]
MIKSILAIATAAVLSSGLTAQVMGSINRGAAKVSNVIEMGSHKLHVHYTAIRFGEGMWKKMKDNADMHERFNTRAESSPLGSVETNCDVQVAGKMVPAGKYSMFFTVHADHGWILNLKPAKGDTIRWGMKLSEGKDTKCMKISLEPSEKNGMCSLSIAFGDMRVTVPVMVAEKKK